MKKFKAILKNIVLVFILTFLSLYYFNTSFNKSFWFIIIIEIIYALKEFYESKNETNQKD